MKMLVANMVSGIAGIIAACFLIPHLMAFIAAFFPALPLVAILAILVIFPGMVGGSAVAAIEWLIGEWRRDLASKDQ